MTKYPTDYEMEAFHEYRDARAALKEARKRHALADSLHLPITRAEMERAMDGVRKAQRALDATIDREN